MQIVFAGVVPKEREYPDNNEDAYGIDKNVVAVSDGASESFDAKSWAQILVRNYINSAQFRESWLVGAIEEYSILHDREALSWSKQASFDRGSFATLLGIEFHGGSNSVNVLAIGDSLAVLISNGRVVESYPYTSFEDFNQNPALLSTNHFQNDFIRHPGFFFDSFSYLGSSVSQKTNLALYDRRPWKMVSQNISIRSNCSGAFAVLPYTV